jgi:hypothetical protein
MPENEALNRYLTRSRTMLTAALQNEDVRSALEPFGYDDAALQDLLTGLEEVESLYRTQREEYAEQYEATEDFYEQFGAVEQQFSRHRRLARVAFKNGGREFDLLNLGGTRVRDFDGFMHQAQEFYTAIQSHPDVAEPLGRFSLTAEVAGDALSALTAVQEAKTTQLAEIEDAQAATQRRDRAMADFRGRMSDLREILRVATADRPQLREAVGMVTPA